jgi:hypothetical protein
VNWGNFVYCIYMPTKKSVPKKRVAVKKVGTTKSKSATSARKKTTGRIRKSAAKKTSVKKIVAIEDLDIHQPAAMPLMMYRRIAVTFTVLVAATLVIVLFLATVQAVIKVSSTQEPISTEFVANVFETPTRANDIRGVVLSGTVGETRSFDASGEGTKAVEAAAIGQVTIYNNLSFVQPLIATTRFLSADGILFRLEDGVSVPAGGSVVAAVYADEEGASGDIEPTTFIVPGLSSIRQESVHAQSFEAFSGGVSYVSVVTESEMDVSVLALEDSLVADAKAMLVAETGEEYGDVSYSVEVLEKTFSIEPDAEVQNYEVTLSLKVTGVFYDSEALGKIALSKLYEGLGQGQEFMGVSADDIEVRVEGVDEEAQEANIFVKLSAPAITSQTSSALDVGRFVGMTEDEVRTLLIEDEIATEVDVEFFPFWIKTVPRLKDHIYIEIK